MRICQICGEENTNDSRHCKSCGGALEKIDLEQVAPEIKEKIAEEQFKLFQKKEDDLFSSRLKKVYGKQKKEGESGWEQLRKKSKTWEEMTPEEIVVRKKTHNIMILWIMIGIAALMFIARFIVF
ncbi:MAG: zinc ribbon domain-containing protein [Candidatus Hydrogenedentota bacterium]